MIVYNQSHLLIENHISHKCMSRRGTSFLKNIYSLLYNYFVKENIFITLRTSYPKGRKQITFNVIRKRVICFYYELTLFFNLFYKLSIVKQFQNYVVLFNT